MGDFRDEVYLVFTLPTRNVSQKAQVSTRIMPLILPFKAAITATPMKDFERLFAAVDFLRPTRRQMMYDWRLVLAELLPKFKLICPLEMRFERLSGSQTMPASVSREVCLIIIKLLIVRFNL